jgi:hypothetical protein
MRRVTDGEQAYYGKEGTNDRLKARISTCWAIVGGRHWRSATRSRVWTIGEKQFSQYFASVAWQRGSSGTAHRWGRALGGFRKVHRNSHAVTLRHPSFRADEQTSWDHSGPTIALGGIGGKSLIRPRQRCYASGYNGKLRRVFRQANS